LPNNCGTKKTWVSLVAEWTSWGNGTTNWRYQSAAQAEIFPSQFPRLQLQWAFGLPNVRSVRSQPVAFSDIVRQGRVRRRLGLVGGFDGSAYALDAATGCTYGATKAKPVRSGLVVARNVRIAAGQYVDPVFYGDASGGVDALDVHTG